jgi:hypothetical protein
MVGEPVDPPPSSTTVPDPPTDPFTPPSIPGLPLAIVVVSTGTASVGVTVDGSTGTVSIGVVSTGGGVVSTGTVLVVLSSGDGSPTAIELPPVEPLVGPPVEATCRC